MTIDNAEKAIGYTFKDKNLLIRALTLSSASSEDNNERLEFLGDAILEYIVSEIIFREGGTEGTLTERRKSLVSDSALAPVSEKLGLDKLLVRGKKDTNNKKAIPSVYEAVCAAIYLDGGMEAAKKFVLSTLDFSVKETVVNYKGRLQECIQPPVPVYECTDVGDAQKHRFIVTVNIKGRKFSGEAEVKKEAEQLAAKAALEYLNNK